MEILLQLVLSGIALGMIYAVIAFGYQLAVVGGVGKKKTAPASRGLARLSLLRHMVLTKTRLDYLIWLTQHGRL